MNNTAMLQEDVGLFSDCALQPENALDLRKIRPSQDPARAARAKRSRKTLEAKRLNAGLCQKCGLIDIDPNVKKTCDTCMRKQDVSTARWVLKRFGYNPDNHLELRLR